MRSRTYLDGVAGLLRRLADRVSPGTAPRRTNWSFTFEHEEGVRFREDSRGCPLWYLGSADYERAHAEADTKHVRVDWARGTVSWHGGDR